jgi:hypothetical protein
LVHGSQSDWLHCLLKLPLEHGQDLEVAEPVAQEGQARSWSRPMSQQPVQEQHGGHPDDEDTQADANRYQDYQDSMPGSGEGVAVVGGGIVGPWVNGDPGMVDRVV